MLKFLLCLVLLFSPQETVVKQELPKQAIVQTEGFVTFEQGWEQHKKDNSPVVVIITTKTCPHCVTMKNTLLSIKKEYPDIVLSEVTYDQAKKLWPSAIKDNRVPQTFMYAWDSEENKRTSFPMIIGSAKKERVYEIWKIK